MAKKLTSLKDLSQDRSNLNIGTDRGKDMIAKSFRNYGGGRSVLVDKEGRIIAGNKSVESAIAAGLDDVMRASAAPAMSDAPGRSCNA